MENQQKRAKRGGEEATDRISELPEPLLHHVLCFLPQKDAVQTCILSKSWRHLGSTRPKMEISQRSFFRGNKNKFLSVLEKTFQRYVDQKLRIQEFILETSSRGRTSCLLNKWIPIVVKNRGLKKFVLRARDFPVPSVVFQAEFLEELELLGGCQINNSIISVKLQRLKRLVLCQVRIEDEAFEKIMSSCPLIEYLQVWRCRKLSTIKVKKARNLKHFECGDCDSHGSIEFNDDVIPSLETIHISRFENWYNNYYFSPRLKSLYLHRVHLPTLELLNNLNCCPCLEKLELRECSGYFTEFKLSNCSIKRLIISVSEYHPPIKVISIDAANMIYFEFELSGFVPSIISFATTTSSNGECKSRIHVRRSSKDDDFPSTWSLELYEFLKALSQKSQISVDIDISCFPPNQRTFDSSCEPVVVEHLCLCANLCSSFTLPSLFSHLFRICRPRYVGPAFSTTISPKIRENRLAKIRESRLAAESTWKALVGKGKKRPYRNWKRDLEKTSIQVLDEKTKEWRPGHACEFPNNQSIRFRLKWRNLSILSAV